MDHNTNWEERFAQQFPYVTEEPYRRNLLSFIREERDRVRKETLENALTRVGFYARAHEEDNTLPVNSFLAWLDAEKVADRSTVTWIMGSAGEMETVRGLSVEDAMKMQGKESKESLNPLTDQDG